MMRSVRTMLAVCGLLAMLSPQYSEAVEEPMPCMAEPTDMTIHYGEIIQCTIGPSGGDSDIFRFSGSAGHHIVLVVIDSNFFNINLCVDLYAPDNSLLTQACDGFSARLGAPSFELPVSGTYRIQVYDKQRNDTGPYNLILERVQPPATSVQQIFYNEPPIETETIDVRGDLDAFTFPAVTDDNIKVTVSSIGTPSILPCVELFAPDGTQVGNGCGGRSIQITPPSFTQAGPYTILIRGRDYLRRGPYVLTVLCTSGPCTAVRPPLCPQCRGRDATLCGTDDDDTLIGTEGDDVIVGKAGDDFISGNGGNDLICGDAGNDTIFGGDGDDQLFGGAGSDALFGESGNDRLFGDSSRDVLYGGFGRDQLAGGAGEDLLFGGTEDDTLNGGSDTDICDNIEDTSAPLACEITVNP